MRQTFHLVRSAAVAEEFGTLRLMAERIHELRGERDLHLFNVTLQGHPALSGAAVSVRAGEQREGLIGYAAFPETRAHAGEGARQMLMEQLQALRPDLRRAATAEVIDFPHEGRAA